jgi:hypothetical protein
MRTLLSRALANLDWRDLHNRLADCVAFSISPCCGSKMTGWYPMPDKTSHGARNGKDQSRPNRRRIFLRHPQHGEGIQVQPEAHHQPSGQRRDPPASTDGIASLVAETTNSGVGRGRLSGNCLVILDIDMSIRLRYTHQPYRHSAIISSNRSTDRCLNDNWTAAHSRT